ncbi:MAG: cysteine desulfurase [Ruminococcaceae bacterium]|nr:cysteine desulfurase [Oscillospiraceae bacterium]
MICVMDKTSIIYLDNSATTRPSDASLKKMREALSVCYGNPGSVHAMGNDAHKMLENARQSIGLSLGVRRPSDGHIIFTSSGSEANNLAVFGSVFAKDRPVKGTSKGKILISDSEHPSVEKPCAGLEKEGFEVLRVPTAGGELDLDFIRQRCDQSCILASFMLVNNETGAVYNVAEAARLVRAAAPKAFIHCDCVQAYMKMRFTPKSLGIDALTVSAHKINAPKGAGALFITADVITGKRLVPVTLGGGQEMGFRSGTENTPAICAFGEAATEGMRQMGERIERVRSLRAALENELPQEVRINRPVNGYDGIVNLTLPMIKSETMLNYLSGEGICISAGSACSARGGAISSVLQAFGLPKEEADCSVRVSISHLNTEEEINIFSKALKTGIKRLARIK